MKRITREAWGSASMSGKGVSTTLFGMVVYGGGGDEDDDERGCCMKRPCGPVRQVCRA